MKVKTAHRENFQFLYNAAIGMQVTLDPSIDARLTTLAQLYGLYRFVALEIRVIPRSGATLQAVGYASYQALAAGIVPTVALVAENPVSVIMGETQTVPVTLKVPHSTLFENGPKWFQTDTNGTTDDSLEIQGRLLFGATSTVLVRGVIEFAQPLPSDYSLTSFSGKGSSSRIVRRQQQASSSGEGGSGDGLDSSSWADEVEAAERCQQLPRPMAKSQSSTQVTVKRR